ncbi:hypothetical protein GCM10009738_60730 [Kitasatospora viridis]
MGLVETVLPLLVGPQAETARASRAVPVIRAAVRRMAKTSVLSVHRVWTVHGENSPVGCSALCGGAVRCRVITTAEPVNVVNSEMENLYVHV